MLLRENASTPGQFPKPIPRKRKVIVLSDSDEDHNDDDESEEADGRITRSSGRRPKGPPPYQGENDSASGQSLRPIPRKKKNVVRSDSDEDDDDVDSHASRGSTRAQKRPTPYLEPRPLADPPGPPLFTEKGPRRPRVRLGLH
ncbi:hypothetical protein Daus18300_005492 [Diaporthe australafricana]|uniref:Uncharacterized protein n=1 Tax=Diaporthe australafricana TaxID=127596 RepID=A0ABR3X1S5_9PEZI